MPDRRCIAVVSPLLDKHHGTERCIAEQVERLAREHGYEVHVYAQRVDDVEALETFGSNHRPGTSREPANASAPASQGRIVWHRISDLPGPHLAKYVWWLLANQFRRWRDQKSRGFRYDLVYSPGINCWDADAVAVHMVFSEFYNVIRDELRFRRLPLRAWPRTLHRRLYYRLIAAMEKALYSNPRIALAAVSRLTAEELRRWFGRDDIPVIPDAVDVEAFSPALRLKRRAEARQKFRFAEDPFVLLLVGNDWKKKGLSCLLQAVARCREIPVEVLVVGHDDRGPYEKFVTRLGLDGHVHFAEPSSDVLQFYAAADAYVGPSVHDAFAMPVAEAMACGLPVIVSRQAGVSEMIRDLVDGLILKDPKDAAELAGKIHLLWGNPELRRELAENAANRASEFNWERNAEQTRAFLECALGRRQPEQLH